MRKRKNEKENEKENDKEYVQRSEQRKTVVRAQTQAQGEKFTYVCVHACSILKVEGSIYYTKDWNGQRGRRDRT